MIKKILLCLITIITVISLCACAGNKTNNDQIPSSTTDTTKNTEVSIPTDSSLADSVFENATNPTKAENGNGTETEDTDGTADVTIPDETSPDVSTENKDSSTDATAPDVSPEEMTYEAFTALTPEEQRLYQESFNDLDAFFTWYVAAKEKYEKENPPIDIDGPVDLGKY